MNIFGLIFHSLTIISVFRNTVIARSIAYLLVYLFLIFNNISVLTLIPILFLLVFFFIILMVSRRANMNGLNKSLDNIGSIDVLERSNSR